MRTGFGIRLLAVLLMMGCGSKGHVPGNIIPQSRMQALIWDLTRADLFIGDYWLRTDSSMDRKTESIKLYQQIFALHHTNKEEFQKSFRFYKEHPLLFKPVLDSLTARSNDAATKQVNPVVAPDSAGSKPQRPPGQGPAYDSFQKLKRRVVK